MPRDQTMELFAEVLHASMGDQLAPGAISFLDMLSVDVVMEFPFAPPGLPQRLNGKTAVSEHLGSLASLIQIECFSSPIVHRTSSGFVLEFACTGIAKQTGNVYNQNYVSVITLHDGQITRYRDYWNPLTVLDAIRPTKRLGEEHS